MIAVLVNPAGSGSELVIRDMQEAARTNGRQLSILKASTEARSTPPLRLSSNCMPARSSSAADPFFNSRREQLVALAARHAVPAIYEWREFAEAGGLISYGPSVPRLSPGWRLCRPGSRGRQACRSADPATDRFELVINLKTAKALGLTIPPTILARADEVIE